MKQASKIIMFHTLTCAVISLRRRAADAAAMLAT